MRWRHLYLISLVLALIIGLGLWTPLEQAGAAKELKPPKYKVDPFWPNRCRTNG